MMDKDSSPRPAEQHTNNADEEPEEPLNFTEHMDAMKDISSPDSQNHYKEDSERLANFDRLVRFFNKDLAIKKSLVDLAPKETDVHGEGSVDYADKLYNTFGDIKHNLQDIMADYYPSHTIEDRLDAIEHDIVGSGADYTKLNKVYCEDFSDISEDFAKKIQSEIFGDYLWSDAHSLDKDAKSINEILHLIHHSIVNDDKVLRNLPVLAKKEGGFGDLGITLYGVDDSYGPLAGQIFSGICNDSKYDLVDIVSMKDHILMMVRGRGHALTVDIQKDPDDQYYVNYFVPKICNVDKVNMLPGVRKVAKKEGVNQAREATTGIFSVKSDTNVAGAILDFIAAVPTDEDMF